MNFRAETRHCSSMPKGCIALALLAAIGSALAPSARAVEYTQHSVFQAVNNSGMSTYNTDLVPLYLKGVVLNNPEDMLNGAPNYNTIPWNMGGQWQVFVQAVEPGDWGGTALWMGQNYGNRPDRPGESYSNEAWTAELLRLNFCGGTETQPFRAGDLIEVYARGTLWYAGKRNVNEQHYSDPDYDFDIRILQRNVGLPAPAKINLADVRTAANAEIFQATDPDGNGVPVAYADAAGGEKHQAQWTTLENVRLKEGEAAKWANNALVMLTDASGREFRLKIGLNASLSPAAMTPPSGTFNVTGIFNQEAVTSPSSMGIDGYQLWLMNAADIVPLVPGDFDGDGFVGAGDYAILQQHWGQNVTPCSLSSGDPSGDGFVGAQDYAILQANWGSGTPPPAPQAVPEPAAWVGLLSGLAALGLARFRRRSAALAAVLLIGLTGTASADVVLSFAPVNNSAGGAALQGFVTQDLMLNTSTDWLNSQLLVTLTNGSVYQDVVGGNTAPNPALFAAFPSLQFDTFVAGGQPAAAADVIGGAVNLGGGAAAKCDATGVDLAWGTNSATDVGNLMLARVSLSSDAQGTWKALMLVRDAGSPNGYAMTSYNGPIVGGAMQVPEPGAFVLLAAGGLGAAALWRRRTRA